MKFRVWFIQQKVMMENEFDCYIGLDGSLYFHDWHYDEMTKIQDSRYVLMRSTGIKDKNGTEAWEGDILQGPWSGECYDDEIDYIIFEKGAFFCKNNLVELFDVVEFWEIIGNIYENPELLKSVNS